VWGLANVVVSTSCASPTKVVSVLGNNSRGRLRPLRPVASSSLARLLRNVSTHLYVGTGARHQKILVHKGHKDLLKRSINITRLGMSSSNTRRRLSFCYVMFLLFLGFSGELLTENLHNFIFIQGSQLFFCKCPVALFYYVYIQCFFAPASIYIIYGIIK
jgi:hypothetical protein